MASFDNTSSSNLTTKLSPLIEGQVPDFVQSDHPLFVKFLKNYYEYLEAGELRVTVTIDDLLLETESTSYVLDVDGNHIVLEDGTGTTGKFTVNETITGSTSKATAKVLVDDLGNATKPRLFISSQQKFETGETITGEDSGSTATVTRYRANPIQNIQQLLEYADTDNTIYDFLDQLRDSFMNAIPTELATGVNKRNLIKNIRELYRAKGTSEGHKIFIRMLLDENADIFYPNKYMLRPSDGKWTYQTILRCSPGVNSVASEVIGKTLTGASSGATAVIANASITAEGGDSIVIFEIDPVSLVGTFTDAETATAISSVQDISMSFTIRGMVTNTTVSNGGILYSVEDSIELDTNLAVGNAKATTKVETIKTGSVSDVVIDDAGTLYEVNDTLTFSTGQANTKAATGFVSVIDGSISMDGTDVFSTNANDNLILEDETTSHVEFFNCILDGTDEAGTNADSSLLLNGTDASSTNAGHNISMEYGISQVTLDNYGTTSDTFALEEGTVNSGEITRIFLKDGGAGYSLLPSITISTTTGTGASLLATTADIGVVDSAKINNQGFKYVAAPDMTFRANFVVKDVSGTFANGNTLTTHTGTVKDYDSTTQVLETIIEDVVRSVLETGDEEEIALEDNLRISTDVKDTTLGINNSADEGDQIVDASGNRIILDAHHTVDGYIVLNGTNINSDNAGSPIVVETGDPHEVQLQRFLTESSVVTSAQLSGAGDTLITNSSIDTSPSTIILDGTDSSRTNAGGDILNEEHGNNNTIILNGTDSDSTDAGAKLLNSIETADGNVALDGTDSSSANAGDNVVGENGIDFSAGTTTITDSSGATATIVNADIAKGTTTIGTGADTTPSYGTSVENLIGEDLIRIQDSFFYQAFSYEVQTDSSSANYLRELKKAVHPAGFAAFGKVSIATAISMAISTTGASLGGGYTADTDTFSPILASTFEVLFDEVMQRRLGISEVAVSELEQVVLLEDDETIGDGFSVQLNGTDSSSTNAGYFLVEESPQFAFTDFDSIGISYGIEAGEFGLLVLNGTDSNSLNAGDKIVPESAEAVTNNLVLDSTPDSGHIDPTDADSDILLDGIDSSATLAGQSIELENSLSDRVTRIGLQSVENTATLINESGGTQQLETSGTSGVDQDVSLVSFVTTKINIPLSTPRYLINGLITLATDLFTGHTDGGGIDLEIGTGGGVLLIDGYHQINVKGGVDRIESVGDEFVLEDGANDNHLSGFTFEQVGNYSSDLIVLNGTNGSSANAGDNILLDGTNADSLNAGFNIEGESAHSYNSFLIEDIIRPSLVVMDSAEFGSKGGSTPVDHVAILLEGEDQGSFKQEDETTVSGTYGDDLLLEDGVGVGINNKLLLEANRIQLEDGSNIGTIPFQNYTNSTVEPFTRPADIETRDSGSMYLEDGLAFGAILLNGTDGSSTNAGREFFLESGTYEDFVRNN